MPKKKEDKKKKREKELSAYIFQMLERAFEEAAKKGLEEAFKDFKI